MVRGNWRGDLAGAILGDFNGFARSVVLRINEVRDLGEHSRYQFNEHMKIYEAAPPDIIRVNQKFVSRALHTQLCVAGDHHQSQGWGMYLTADDRRHYVAWSEAKQAEFAEGYWRKIWHWYEKEGGFGHVAAYLATLDISDFDPKEPPTKTEAFWTFVHSHRAPEGAELADTLDKMGKPQAVTIDQIGQSPTELILPCG